MNKIKNQGTKIEIVNNKRYFKESVLTCRDNESRFTKYQTNETNLLKQMYKMLRRITTI